MNSRWTIVTILLCSCVPSVQIPGIATAQGLTESGKLTLEQVKSAGALQSSFQKIIPHAKTYETPQANLKTFREEIEPVLKKACYECHGSVTAEGEFRVDTLNPDLLHGDDVSWWLEVVDVLSNDEMPPEDGPELADENRSRIIDWLSSEILIASQVRRSEEGHSSFRRMTRYEYNYALQDLLGLELDFAKDLQPDPVSEDGFRNSSEMLQITVKQYGTYLELNRNALNRATVRGERPEMLYWGVSAQQAFADKIAERQERAKRAENQSKTPQAQDRQRNGRDNRGSQGGRAAHYKNLSTGQTIRATWNYLRAAQAWAPTTTRPEVPAPSDYIAVLPAGQRLVVELGNRLPDEGTLRVRIRASRVSDPDDSVPSMALEFGWVGNKTWSSSTKISEEDLVIDAAPGKPMFYQWDVRLSDIHPRNPARKTTELNTRGINPSEYIRLHNTSTSNSADIHLDYVEVSAPVYDQWPPASHSAIFFDSENRDDELTYAREIVSRFMARAWRRNVTEAEVDLRMELFAKIRPLCEDFEQAVIETLAAVLSSPRFLYLVRSDQSPTEADRTLDEFELATRLAMFLWCSTPDDELLELAAKGHLSETDELVRQTRRMLADPRHERFSKHFVRQWLTMDLLDHVNIDDRIYPDFDNALKEAMKQEPIAFFEEVLQSDRSVMDFIHADYAMVNARLAKHYGISDVDGNHFRKVPVKPEDNRGGLLTQAGLLAMNSDGTDSHPLKRGIWLLESILNDPPPPPPPAVPEVDLADPEILKMTLKERMEDHRNKAACLSCHVKIDPWGLALENFDAVGGWRTENRGKEIDASGLLYNHQNLDGVDGLKRYLLSNRQDQFARAIVHKMATFALGRPLTFADHADIDRLTAELRKKGDGLATLVTLLVTSELFQSQ